MNKRKADSSQPCISQREELRICATQNLSSVANHMNHSAILSTFFAVKYLGVDSMFLFHSKGLSGFCLVDLLILEIVSVSFVMEIEIIG